MTTFKNQKIAVFTMDIEDWYHLDYFNSKNCDKRYTMLDGINKFREILNRYNIPATYFVVGDIAHKIKDTLIKIINEGSEISAHGWDHVRPIKITTDKYLLDLKKTKSCLEAITNKPVIGYRAPCFSMDRKRLNEVKKANYLYDVSKVTDQ